MGAEGKRKLLRQHSSTVLCATQLALADVWSGGAMRIGPRTLLTTSGMDACCLHAEAPGRCPVAPHSARQRVRLHSGFSGGRLGRHPAAALRVGGNPSCRSSPLVRIRLEKGGILYICNMCLLSCQNISILIVRDITPIGFSAVVKQRSERGIPLYFLFLFFFFFFLFLFVLLSSLFVYLFIYLLFLYFFVCWFISPFFLPPSSKKARIGCPYHLVLLVGVVIFLCPSQVLLVVDRFRAFTAFQTSTPLHFPPLPPPTLSPSFQKFARTGNPQSHQHLDPSRSRLTPLPHHC